MLSSSNELLNKALLQDVQRRNAKSYRDSLLPL